MERSKLAEEQTIASFRERRGTSGKFCRKNTISGAIPANTDYFAHRNCCSISPWDPMP